MNLGQKRTAKRKPIKVGRPIKGRRGLQRKADTLFSQEVRARAGNKCEYCGRAGTLLHCHHGIVHRRYLNTRYEFDNCASLCVSCHNYLGDFPRINTEWFIKRVGTKRFEEIEILARSIDGKFDYQAVLDRLALYLQNELGKLE